MRAIEAASPGGSQSVVGMYGPKTNVWGIGLVMALLATLQTDHLDGDDGMNTTTPGTPFAGFLAPLINDPLKVLPTVQIWTTNNIATH
jgi:hypothetical protein